MNKAQKTYTICYGMADRMRAYTDNWGYSNLLEHCTKCAREAYDADVQNGQIKRSTVCESIVSYAPNGMMVLRFIDGEGRKNKVVGAAWAEITEEKMEDV